MIDGKAPESGELEMKSWLKKLKENQDRRREEKLKKYNDVISKFIIVLVAICIVCMIAVAALFMQNEVLRNDNKQLTASYDSLNISKNGQIQQLQNDNNDLKNFIFSNRSINDFQHTVYIDPNSPKVSQITFNTNKVTVQFADGTTQEKYFIDYDINITNPGSPIPNSGPL